MKSFTRKETRDMWVWSRMIIAIIPAFLFCTEVSAQLVVTEAATAAEVEQYVQDVLLGSCATVSNFNYTGQAWGSGTFDGTGSNIGMDGGIIMTTGRASYAIGPDNVDDRTHNQNNGGDADLDQLLNFGFTTEDAVILEFDFVPQDDTLRFNYIFGSEEYPEYVNSGFNDVFGFFISGPGYAGPFSNGAENIALIPGTTTPVAINNLNNGYSANEPATGPCLNCAYYVENGGGATIQYDAFTTVLTALAVVQPCSTYHIKMAVADAGDHSYDSGVFLQEGSFSAGGGVSVEIETSNIPPGIYEGCNDAWFVFRRLDVLNNGSPITADFTIGGTATPGVDYTALPTTITIPAGEDSLLVNIAAWLDGLVEGTETITLTLDDPPCSCQAPESAVIDILDNNIPLSVATAGSTTICVGQSANLTALPVGSQTPYTQSWDNGLGSGLNQTVSPTTTTTYTYTVSDACGGQTAQSSETVTVVRGDFTIDDDEQCFQGNNFSFTNAGTSNGTVSHFWDFGDGSGTSTQENPTYSYGSDGNYTVTHHVIFIAAGCTTSVSADVDVWEMPTASMASTNLVCAGDNDGTAAVTASDGTPPYSYNWTPGGQTTAAISNLPVGTYNVTVTDAHGCTATDQAIITQVDIVPPNAICQNITVQLDASGNVGISATQINNGSTDNCGIASMVVFPNTFNCSNVGNNTVTLTVTDVNGNQAICNATVTVQDLIPPTALCQNITVQLDASGNASISAAQIDNGSTDNCGVQSITVNPSTFSCSDVGANPVVLTVTDVNGNVSTCNATVTVEDNILPTVSCNNITVQLDATGNASIVLADIDNGAADNCAIDNYTLSQSSFDCSDVGINVVTVTVTDVNGNSAICNATVTVEDNIPPTVVCNNINLYLDGSGSGGINLADIDGGASDNCGIASSALSPSNFNCGDVGPNNVNVTVWDVNGNTSNCNSTVTVIDTVSPNALCQNITIQLDATGNASISVNDIDAGSTDNCGIATRVLDITSFDCSDVGVNTVTLTVTDVNGNTDVCTATVTVEDNVFPSAICQNITVELDAAGNVSIVAGDVDNGSADNCAIQSMVVNPSSFDCSDVGLNVVTLTVTDVNGNVSTCTSNVNVEDNLNPTVICNSITVSTDVSGNVTITAADIDGGSNDNCGLASLSVIPSSFDCNNLGPNTVTLTATDFSGNVSTCTATVTVEDNLPPTAICQNITAQLDPDGNVTIAAGDIDNGSTDPCGLQSITVVPSSFDCTNIGPNVVTLTVTDIAGNVSTCTATVNVVDEVIPIALCQDITVFLDATGNVSIEPQDIDNGSNDACGSVSAITVVPSTFDCNDQGGNAVTLTVEDSNGNQAICVATVTVIDPIPPTAFCQDISVSLNAIGQASITPAMIDNGSFDNCAIVSYSVTPNQFNCSHVGGNLVTMTVIDNAGNSSTCTATVTVEENIAPNAICQDITVQLDATGNVSITAAQINNGSTDNCGIQSMSVTPNSFTCAAVGGNPVTLTVTDLSGNVSTCSATVTVQDNVNPTAICQDISVQLDATGNVTINSTQIDNGSSDACGIASMTLNNDSFNCSNIGPNTVVLTVTDNNGNISTCQSTVTIEDNVPPVTLCQGTTIYLDSLGSANISAYTLDNGSNDACGIDTILINQSVYDCSELGVNQGIITVFDVNGNSSTCQSDVNVLDTVSPYFINCPTDITVVPDSNNCEPVVTWTPPTGLDNCTPTVTSTHNPGDNFPVGTTTVTYTVIDQSGNSNTCSFDVTIEPVVLMVSLTSPEFICGSNISCNGLSDGSIETYVSGGCLPYTYSWSNGQTGETAIDLVAGTYDITVTDVNGTQATATITLTQPEPLVITSITASVYEGGWNISCAGANDGSVVATIEGGADCEVYEMRWSDLNTAYSFTETATGLQTGTYFFNIQDANGCQALDSINLSEPDSLELILDPQVYSGGYNVSCAGASDGMIDLTVLNGTPPYTVSWDNGESTEDISGLEAGTYVATVTDANGCVITDEITLTEPVEIASVITSPTNNGFNISCNGLEDGSLDLTVSGGTEPYLYLWNSGDATEDLANLGAGIYSVTITDANGCVHIDSIVLIQPDELVLNSLDTGLITCNGDVDGSFTVGASGGVPSYSYTWSNGASGATALNLTAGLYTAYVQDLNGCSDSLLLQLDEPLELVAQVNAQIDVSCFQGDNGLVDVGVTGGTAPYSFQWTNGETTEDLNGVEAGTYTLTVTDANFCQTQVTAVIEEPTQLVLVIDSIIDVTCAGMSNGQAWISASGGTSPYTYLWSTGHQTSFVIGLSAGIHQVTVTDNHGCSEVISVEVSEPPVLFANLNSTVNVGCNGGTDGSAQVDVIGGVEPYSYQWSNGDTLNITDSLSAGNQFVVVSDANGCDTTINFIMDEPATLNVVSALAQDPACFGDSTGLIQISITGGTEPYYPLWEDGQTTLQANGFGAGDHIVVVTDYNGCEDSLTVTLSEPTQLEIFDMVVIEPLCNGTDDGSATVIVQGGVAPYFYDWQPSGSTSASASNLSAGDHIVVITDQHNCVLTDTVNMIEPDPVMAFAIGDTAVCPSDTALVWAEATGGAGNYSYLWNQGLGIAQGAEVVPTGTTEYVVIVTDSAGCSSAPDTMTVTVAPLPDPSFTYTSPDFCAYPVQLDIENTTVGGATFEWFFGNGDVSNLQDPSATYDEPGLYTITMIAYSDIGCTDTTSITYEASEVPTASFSLDGMEGCSPVIVNFQDFSENANTYMWDFGDGSTSVLPDPSHIYDSPGDYDITLVVSTPGGCSDTMMLGAGVTVWPSPIADFDPILMNPDSGAVYQFINLSTGAVSYEWDFSDGVSSNLDEPYHEFLTNGNVDILLIAVNEFGCIDTAMHVLEIDVFTGLNVPNALAAGEVGETGLFLPKGTGLVQYQAMVFDEWGNLLWESNALENGSPAEGWDGTFNGTRVPQGAYVWKIDAEFYNGHVWEGMRYGHEKYRNTGSVSVVY